MHLRLSPLRATMTIVMSAVLLTSCGTQKPETKAFVAASQVGAMAPLANGGLRYGERLTGNIFDVDSKGQGASVPVAHVDVSNGGQRGLIGLAVDKQDRTFAAWSDPAGVLQVAQVLPGPVRSIWQGPATSDVNIGGRLAITPTGRVLVGIGDLQDLSKIGDANAYNGKLVTLDPDKGADQTPNIISKNYVNPQGLAYGPGDVLWVTDSSTQGEDRLGRAGDDGMSPGSISQLGKNVEPSGLTAFGSQELALCLRGPRQLKRFLVQDAQALPGRVVAKDCTLGVVVLKDGTLAYATDTEIRTSLK